MTINCLKPIHLALTVIGLLSFPAFAQSQGPFGAGWTLDAENSRIGFQSIKNLTKVEQSSLM